METTRVVISIEEEREAREHRGKMEDLAALLSRSDKEVPLAILSNAILILGHDPLLVGLCGFDEFTNSYVLRRPAPNPLETPELPGPYPRPWTSPDISHVQSYIQRAHIKGMGRQDTEDAMTAVAATSRFHPVRDWLDTLQWDGLRRLETWLSSAFGAKKDRYHESVGMNFLIAAVRRVRKPGCKFDHMMILEGIQNLGKSSAVKILFGEKWFTDSLPSKLESRDSALGLQGAWCVEFAEIEQIIRTEVEVIKAFLSRSTDRFRAPYGRAFISYPRQCVFIGTTNDREYLRDPTGNRRFWPIECKTANVKWLQDNREQLWAEAANREEFGEAHWIFDEDGATRASEIQAERAQEDVWEDRIASALAAQTQVTSAWILTDVLSLTAAQQTRREQMRVSAIMMRQGWVQVRSRVGGKLARRWKRRSECDDVGTAEEDGRDDVGTDLGLTSGD